MAALWGHLRKKASCWRRIWGRCRTLLPSFLRPSSAPTWKLLTASPPLLDRHEPESGPGCRALMTCSLHRTIGSFHWRGSKVAQVTWEHRPGATNINPVLGPLHCNSLDIFSLSPFLLSLLFSFPPSLYPLPLLNCSPLLAVDLLNTHFDRAGHLQESRSTGQNIPSLSSLGDGAEPWSLQSELGWADIYIHFDA